MSPVDYRPMRVVIVDDDEEQLSMVSRMLRVEGCDVETTSSPFGVSNLVTSFRPDVVLIDVNIPALSGDKILSVLRRHQSEARLVLFSAADESTLRRLAGEVGADAWIQKGGDAKEMAERLLKLVL